MNSFLYGLLVGGGVISTAFFYVYFVMRPKWIKQGANDFKRKLQADDVKILKLGKRTEEEIDKMNDDEIWDYITNHSN